MLKAIDKDTHISKDEHTGEPVAIIHRYKGYGRDNDKVKTEWHPHVLALHPELNNLIHQQSITNSKERADSQARNYLEQHRDGKTTDHEVGIEQHEDGTRTVHLKRKDGTVIASFKGGDAKYNSLGHDRLDDPTFKFHSSPIMSAEQSDVAHAKLGRRSGDFLRLSGIREIAPHIEAAAVSKGPRFKGETSQKVSSGKSVYTTRLNNPREAIQQYIETNIKPEHKAEVNWPAEHIAMTSSADDLHNHIIKFKDGKIHHTKTSASTSSYDQSQLAHVIESTVIVEWDEEKIKAAWKKTASMPDTDYAKSAGVDKYASDENTEEGKEAKARFLKAKAEFRSKATSYS